MSYIGAEPTTSAFPFDQFSGNGTTTAFTLTYAPASTTSIIVAISGVVQNPNLYSVVGTTITFSPAPPTGTNNISVLYLGLPVQIGTPIPGSRLELALGSAANPSLTFLGDTNTGIFSPAADTIAFAEGGTEVARFDSSGNLLIGNAIAGSISPALRIGNSGSGGGVVTATLSLGSYSTGYGSNIISSTDFNSSTASYLAFGTTAVGASGLSAPVERMRIDSSGNLLVGTTNTSISAGNGVKILPTTGPNTVSASTANGDTGLHMYSSGAANFRFYVGWGGTIYATSTTISGISDVRLKENIRDLDDGLEKVMALQPRKFDWKEGKGKGIANDRGFIAQEFGTVFPDMIEEWKDPAPEGEEPYKSVNANLIPTLVKAIQEQQQMIETLQAEVALLKGAA